MADVAVKTVVTLRVFVMWVWGLITGFFGDCRKNWKKLKKSCRRVSVRETLSAFRREMRRAGKNYLLSALVGCLTAIIIVRVINASAPATEQRFVPEEPAPVQESPAELYESAVESVELSNLTMEEQTREDEAEAMARVLYGTAQKCSADAQRAICWLIINRTESSLYPDTVSGVCAQPSQWMGYSDDNPVIEDLYRVAREVVDAWHDGGRRMIGTDFLYMTWEGSTISLRTSFTENSATRYWHG